MSYYVLTNSTPSAKLVAGPFRTRTAAVKEIERRHDDHQDAERSLTIRKGSEIEWNPPFEGNAR